jgi:hypothetical protein
MEQLLLEPKAKTPLVNFDNKTGVMFLKGMSCSENSLEFYRPVLDWVERYGKSPLDSTTVNIEFKYFNTSSAKCILDVLEKFANIYNMGNNVVFNWHYEKNDEEMLEAGENFSEILGIPFNIREIEVD